MFDYLRDNGMATTIDEQVQLGHYYCIIDEVDSIYLEIAYSFNCSANSTGIGNVAI